MSEVTPEQSSVSTTGRRNWWIPIAVLVWVGVAGIVALGLVVLKGGDTPAGASVRLESANQTGADPFTESVAIGAAVEFPGNVEAVNASVREDLPPNADTGTKTAGGTTPGLYGGSGEKSMCDPAKMVAFLAENPSKAAAWAAVFGIDTDAIDEFVGRLTPVVLTSDTMVTNHGFRNGRATAIPAVLQAGTAVMVDGSGVPRVKCNCGNPLAPPPSGSFTAMETVGDEWSGYAPAEVVSVRPGQPTGSLVLTEVTTGEPVTVPVGSAPATMSFGAGTAPATTAATAPAGSGVDLRSVDWNNHSYHADQLADCSNGDADKRLTNGAWEDVEWGVQLTGVLYGEVTGDDSEDAIVTLECFAVGGNAGPNTVNVAFRSTPDGPVQIGSFPGADARLDVRSVITTDSVLLEGEARCCPSGRETNVWRFDGNIWVATPGG